MTFEFGTPECNTAETSSVTTYAKGVWIERVSIARRGEGWEAHTTRRDPFTFRCETDSRPSSVRRRGSEIDVVKSDGSQLLWEASCRLVIVEPSGMRSRRSSDMPIVVFAAPYFIATRLIIENHLSALSGDEFHLGVLEEDEVIEYRFARAERCADDVGPGGPIFRWAGERPLKPTLCPEAALFMTAPFDLLISSDNQLVGWFQPTQDLVTVFAGYEPCSPVRYWQRESVSEVLYTTVTLAETAMAAMPDGVMLAATVLVPGDAAGQALSGPFPAVLMRTPYGRRLSLQDAFKFVSRGYAVVSQDVRGRGESEGEFHPLRNDKADGDATLNWIAAQPWNDGAIGMIGASYLGWVQWQAAASGNRHLRALIPIAPAFGAFSDLPYVNGMFSAGMLTWAIWMGASAEALAEALRKDLNAIASELPLIEADVRAVGHAIPFWREWVSNPAPGPYWQDGEVVSDQANIDLPAMHVVGWYDDILRGTMSAWEMMAAHARPHQRLVAGPWPHGVNSVRRLSELSFGSDSCRADLQSEYVRWFDRWLKGIANGVDQEPAVQYFTMGKNCWQASYTWPPKDATRQIWFLAVDGRLSRTEPGGEGEADIYVHDPQTPAPYLVDIRANQLSAPEDYRVIEQRPDVLVYTSEPFETAVEVTGGAIATLFAATDQPDTDWVVRITDVFPDGRSINIIDGYLRASFRDGADGKAPVMPGEIVRYRIPMTWTSYRFEAGHQIRLLISSAAAGAFVVNTNTGNPLATDVERRVAQQRVFRDGRHPSHLELPICERVIDGTAACVLRESKSPPSGGRQGFKQ